MLNRIICAIFGHDDDIERWETSFHETSGDEAAGDVRLGEIVVLGYRDCQRCGRFCATLAAPTPGGFINITNQLHQYLAQDMQEY